MKLKNILFIMLFFVPFTYSLAINLKVPIKTYEILFVIFLSIWFFQSAIKGQIKLEIDSVFKFLAFFLIWAGFATIISYFKIGSFSSLPDWIPARGSFFLSPVIEIFYLVLNISIAVFISKLITNKCDFRFITKILLVSSLFVCLYGLYIFFSKLLGLPYFSLPTMSGAVKHFGFILPRVEATFKEPNFFAGYLAALIPMTWAVLFLPQIKERFSFNNKLFFTILIIVQLFALALTFSAGGIISVFVCGSFFTILFVVKLKKRAAKLILFILGMALIGFILSLRFGLLGVFNEAIFVKLFSADVNPMTWSRIERWQQFSAAISLFVRYPIFGVGLSNFGLFFDRVLGIYYGFEATANNIFIELLAETGLIGFLLFTSFFVVMFKRFLQAVKKIRDTEETIILIGLWSSFVAIITTWNFYPSYSLSFFWVMFGIYIGYLRLLENGNGAKQHENSH